MKKQWKRLAALSSAVVMAAASLAYFPGDTLQNISWGIAASADAEPRVCWKENIREGHSHSLLNLLF